jgi:hypothetical protein
LFPFYEADNPWEKVVYRVINVALGCVIGTLGSILVLPGSTTILLHERVLKQCTLAGEASEAVLRSSADLFSGHMTPIEISEELLETRRSRKRRLRGSLLRKNFLRVNKAIIEEGSSEVALEKYESAIKDWREPKGLFPLSRFVPFQYIMNSSKDAFRVSCASPLSRSLRIQTTVVLLDGIIRNDPQYSFDQDILTTLTEIGTLIRKSAKEFLLERLALMRQGIVQIMASFVADVEALIGSKSCANQGRPRAKRSSIVRGRRSSWCESTGRRGKRNSIICEDGSNRHTLLFLQLVEHLALHCIALCDSWTEIEELASAEA